MNNVFLKYYIFALFIMQASLIGCGSPSYSSRNNAYIPDKTESSTYEGEELTSQTNVIKGGLGYSFDTRYDNLNLTEYEVPEEVKKYGELLKRNTEEFFPVIKLRFSPISKKLLLIEGIKLYPMAGHVGRFPCYEDAQILKNTIKTKYPSLKEYTPYLAKKVKDLIGYGFAPRLEHKTIKYRFTGPSTTIYPKGNHIKIECSRGGQWSILSITYENNDVRQNFLEEHKIFMKNNEKKVLDQKGIDPSKL